MDIFIIIILITNTNYNNYKKMAFQLTQKSKNEQEINGKIFDWDLADESNETDLSTFDFNPNKPIFE